MAFDFQAYLKAQRELAEASLDMARNAQEQFESAPERAGKRNLGSLAYFFLVLAGLLVAAGFLVVRPGHPPSEEVLALRAEIQKLKRDGEAFDATQKELLHTQEALRAANAELVRTQEALRAAQGLPAKPGS